MPIPSERELTESGLARWLPVIGTLRSYQRAWLAKDLFAGIALTAVLVPVGVSYAEAAGLPVIAGLYASVAGLAAYAIFGPSRVLVLGPDSALAALIASAIAPLSTGSAGHAVALASMLAIMSGAVCVALGLMKLGFVSDLLSHPIRYGYLNGTAITLVASQLPTLLGFHGGGATFFADISDVYHRVLAGEVHVPSAAVGVTCIAAILMFRKYAPFLPGIFIVSVAAAGAGWWLSHESHVPLPVVGPMPSGIAVARVPTLSVADIRALCGGAIAIAFVSFADISVLSRVFAWRADRAVDRNQELIALGAANLLAGFFQGCPVSSSASRTPVARAAGAQTQIAGVVAAICTASLLFTAPALLAYVPYSALAAVVMCASLGIVEIRNVARLYRLRRSEFAISMLCFAGVVLLGVLQGVFISVGLAMVSFVWRAWHPYDAVLGRVAGRRGYHDISRHPQARPIPGLVLFRWDAPLFFANANMFADHLRRAVAGSAMKVEWVIVAAEPITDIDVTAAEILETLHDELDSDGIRLCFAEMKGPVKDRLRVYGLLRKFGDTAPFFATVSEAVEHCAAPRRGGSAEAERAGPGPERRRRRARTARK